MPKTAKGIILKIDFLRSQDQSQRVYSKLIKWLLSKGRFILVFVELLVLIAFISRFKLDADLAAIKEQTEQYIPYVESLRPDENLIRQLQFQIAKIKEVKQDHPDYSAILQKISTLTPISITISNLNLQKNAEMVDFKITGVSQINQAISAYVFSLRKDLSFTNVNLETISFDQGQILFTIKGTVNFKNLAQN